MLQEVSGIRKTVFSLYSGVGGGAGGDVDDETATKNRIIMEQEKEIDFLKQRMKVRESFCRVSVSTHPLCSPGLWYAAQMSSQFIQHLCTSLNLTFSLPFKNTGDPGPDAGLGA